MREILFRGKRYGDGEWVFGHFYETRGNGKNVFRIYEWLNHKHHTIIPETVGQFTGLTDKNGKKIFEGDICRFREWSKGDMCWIGNVHYEHQQFVISGNPNKECESEFLLVMSRFIPENIEKIGNIHDNPELLGGADNG